MNLNVLLISFLFLLVACNDDKEIQKNSIDTLAEKSAVVTDNTPDPAIDTLPEKLVVVTRNAPTTWYHGREDIEGPEYDLINAFADYQKISLEVEVVDSISEVLQWVKDGKAQIAAAGLTDTEERRQQGIIFGPQYHQVQQLVVCRRKTIAIPKTVADLVGIKITVIKDSSYVDRLQQLKQNNPELDWTETDEMDTEQLLKMVWEKQIDCTVADSNIVSINRRYFPELLVAFALSEKQPLAWVINDKWDFLRMKIDAWFEREQTAGKIAALHEKYYGHIDLFNFVDMRAFNRRIKNRYPTYKELFEKASNKYGLDPTLLAAQSYQESHWNPKAKSPTGVRGMMMLTLPTAKEVGVKSRLNAEQSINGGAKYLSKLIKRIPQEVKDENRIWFALAAYNIGFGHLRDARKLAKSLGKNPNVWADLKQVLPLLSQKKYYKKLKYGYARGTEPVRYVQRIRNYQQVLDQNG